MFLLFSSWKTRPYLSVSLLPLAFFTDILTSFHPNPNTLSDMRKVEEAESYDVLNLYFVLF
jgi:hypothetical protein